MYWFCHTSTCIHHGCICVPNPEPPISLGHPSAPTPSILYPASNRLVIRFLYDIIHVLMPFSQIIPPSPSSTESKRLISFRMDWLDLLADQGTLKSLLQHHSSKASILWHSAFFTVQLSHPYITTGKTIVLTRRTFVAKVLSLLLNVLSRLVITFLPKSKRL